MFQIHKLAPAHNTALCNSLRLLHDPLNHSNRNVVSTEHLALPTSDDIRERALVTKIAAHVVDLVKPGVCGRAFALDWVMARARKHLDWDAQFECAIDGERARSIHKARGSGSDACSMCGELCAIEVMKRALERQG